MKEKFFKYRGRSVIGWGPWKRQWIDVCSAVHNIEHEPDPECERCMAGYYELVGNTRLSQLFHNHFYRLWYWWVNRKGSDSKKKLQRWFPNLK